MKDRRRLRRRLAADAGRLKEINRFLLDPSNPLIEGLLEVVERHGGPEEINRTAREAGKLENLLTRLDEERSPYRKDLDWLTEQRDRGAFIPMEEYRRRVRDAAGVLVAGAPQAGGTPPAGGTVGPARAVTLEISALQFFPWLIAEARQAIERRELMPGRYIRVRRMAEQVADHGDTRAVAAAMRIIGASWVETLDTKGTDGSNVHLGGPETITGYFGGVGEPNDYPLRWIDEYLGYYTRYGIRQVLNVNPGTVLAAYLLHKMGVDCEFKISVFMGNDNPWSVLWTLLTARLFSRPDGSSSLIGFNFSNSVTNDTIRVCDRIRASLGLADAVRFEHHITETAKSIVRQPYLRRDELVELARTVSNISAKHEGGDPDVEAGRAHPSDILDYFIPQTEIEAKGLMPAMLTNYLDKHDAVNRTAAALLRAGIGVVAAPLLHGTEA
ncbi:MAG: hypothetical protein A2177_13965 [Spirochaetes bacterium RBG_13_68_11]|nr:MAG: hypothetical protein A2177_13965 [Spirochaetes bacterium RBG_13_68_11]